MSSDTRTPDAVRRRALKVAVCSLCTEVGFQSADESPLETLIEMLQSYISELGRSTRTFCELSCRTKPLHGDVVLACAEMGTDVMTLPAYAKRANKTLFLPPSITGPAPQPRTLQVGKKRQHPSHIADYMPAFPDPHTYIRTDTYKKPVTDYQVVREKAATQKRDVELALTRFIAKTGETECLFPDDPYAYPLIANCAKPVAYRSVLLPRDEDLSQSQPEDDPPQAPPPGTPTQGEPALKQEPTDPSTPTPKPPEGAPPAGTEGGEIEGQIDNPYLRSIKMPKLKTTGGKKYKWS